MRHFITLVVILYILIPPLTAVAIDQQAFEKALMIEAEGEDKFEDALKLLKAPKHGKKDPYDRHRAILQNAIKTLKAVRVYEENIMLSEAQKLLDDWTAKPEYDLDQDIYILIVMKNRLQEIREKKWETVLKKGEKLLIEKKYDEALAQFDLALKAKPDEISAEHKNRAIKGKTQAEAKKKPGFLRKQLNSLVELGQFMLQVVFYFVMAVVAVVLVWVYKGIHRRIIPKREGIELVIKDHMVDKKQQEENSLILSRQVANKIRSIAKGGSGGILTTGMVDLDGRELAGTDYQFSELAAIASHIDDTAVKFGYITFSPKQIFRLIRLLFRREFEEKWVGVLSKSGNRMKFWVEEQEHNGTPVEGTRYESFTEGSNARNEAVRDLAIHIVLSPKPTKAVTWDRNSLRTYLKAEKLLSEAEQSENPEEKLQKALKELRESIMHDPANWMARFKIATVRRMLGDDNEAAADQYQKVLKLANKAPKSDPYFKEFLEKNEEFIWMVQYQRAITLAKQSIQQRDPEPNQEALNIIEKLLENELVYTRDQEQNSLAAKKRRMVMLVRSAKAFALGIRIEHLRYTPKDTDKDKKRLKREAFNEIEEEKRFLEQQMENIPRDDSRVYAKAHVIVLNALGRACFLKKKYDDAVMYFKEALSEHMPEDSVDTYVNLAAVYWKQKEDLATDWWVKAEEWLKRALEINPTNRKANHLLGRVYSFRLIKNFDEAKTHFKRAGAEPWSTFCLAEILINQDQNYFEGIRLLRQSISLDPTPDDRFDFFLKTIMTLINQKQLPEGLRERDLLSDAKNMAKSIIDQGKSNEQRARADFYLAQILIDKEGYYLEGIELLKESISLDPKADDRYVYFLDAIPALVQKKKLPEDQLEYAKDLAEKLKKEGSTAKFKNKGAEYLKKP